MLGAREKVNGAVKAPAHMHPVPCLSDSLGFVLWVCVLSEGNGHAAREQPGTEERDAVRLQ